MRYPEAVYRDLFVSSCPARVGGGETMHEDAGGALTILSKGVPMGAECPGGQSALRGLVRLALGRIMGLFK